MIPLRMNLYYQLKLEKDYKILLRGLELITMRSKKRQILLLCQIIINIVIIGYLLINNVFNSTYINILNKIFIVVLSILLIANLCRKQELINKSVCWLDILTLPEIFSYCLNVLANTLLIKYPNQSLFIVIIYFISFLVFLLPIVFLDLKQIKNQYSRLLIIIWILITLSLSDELHTNDQLEFWTNLSGSEIINGLALIVFSFCLFKQWNIKAKIDLSLQRSNNQQIWFMLFLFIFTIWYSFAHSFFYIAGTFGELFWRTNLDTIIIPSWRAFLWALGAILFEEVFRYLLIITCLKTFRQWHGQIELTILLSSLFFSLFHYTSLISGRMPFIEVTAQVIFTFGYGAFLTTLYLYFGKLWLLMLSHFLLDFLAFSLPSSGGILSLYGNNDFLAGGLSGINGNNYYADR